MDITFDNFNTGITNFNSSNNIEVSCYPNPTKDYAVFEFRVLGSEFRVDENNQIRVTNAVGQQVASLVIENEKVIWNTQKIKSGVYYYRFESNGIIQAGKLIISH